MQGFLLIDKPTGMTSHDVVNRIRRITGERRVGHAGTLDPFATGLLIVGVGRGATREMQKLVGLDKTYESVFVLGASSTTDDPEGDIVDAPLAKEFTPEDLTPFTGEIEQIPPSYSAIKIGGKKMYEAARAGKPLQAEPRNVTIYSFTLLEKSEREETPNLIPVHIHCSSGTYIRALARDLGAALGGGGYVRELRRTSIGPFQVKDAHTLEALPDKLSEALIPVETLLGQL